jgi:homocysteine S-methyltransferase
MTPFEILDGAMGSELIKRGLILPNHIWSADANIHHPKLVKKIHREYIDAGADFITANTFRTTPRAYMKTGLSEQKSICLAKDSLIQAMAIARDAAGNTRKVLGSVAPLEDCYSPKLFPGRNVAIPEFHQLGKWLVNAGADILLLETMNSIEETESALIGIRNLGLHIWISFVLKDGQTLLSGESIAQTIEKVKYYPVDCIMFNCNPLFRTLQAAGNLVKNWPYKWGVYPNLGVGVPSPDGHIIHYEIMDDFVSTMNKIIKNKPYIIGACCGSSPYHISQLFKLKN